MTEKSIGNSSWSKGRALRRVRMIKELFGKDRLHNLQSKVLQNNPDSGLNKVSPDVLISDVNQDPQAKEVIKEVEEILHNKNRTS